MEYLPKIVSKSRVQLANRSIPEYAVSGFVHMCTFVCICCKVDLAHLCSKKNIILSHLSLRLIGILAVSNRPDGLLIFIPSQMYDAYLACIYSIS